MTHPEMPHLIDRYRTGNYGEECYADGTYCASCGAAIRDGEKLYDIDGTVLCLACEPVADEMILNRVRENYIFDY